MTRKTLLPLALLPLLLVAGPIDGATTAAPAPSTPPPESKMKQYIFGMLKRGPNRNHDRETAAKIQEGHLAHLGKCAESGKLVVAGPFGDDGEWRGILIYDVPTLEEAKALCEADPAVKAGRLVCELHPWWAEKGTVLK